MVENVGEAACLYDFQGVGPGVVIGVIIRGCLIPGDDFFSLDISDFIIPGSVHVQGIDSVKIEKGKTG